MALETCGNNVHKLCVTISSTNDTITVMVEHVRCGLTDWHGEVDNTIQ